MNSPQLQRGVFLALLAVVTVAFLWVLMPFFGAVLWGVALAILFTPLYKRLLKQMPGRHNAAALSTLTICLFIVILPLAMVGVSLVQEIVQVTQNIRSGQINFAAYFQQILNALPQWLLSIFDRFNLGDMEAWQARISAGAAQGSQLIAGQALTIGQNTFDFVISFFVMLYLLYFLVRDGAGLSKMMREAVPLAKPHTHYLLNKFTTVIRATVKGNVAVAIAQGAIGGIAFWLLGVQGALLWAVLMAFLSLLPAVGAALIWGPVAIYYLATGHFWQGGILIFIGVFVIGLVDNVLRPVLVGKDTQMPDYIVLMSTIGGMAIFGVNGFVIGPVIAALFMAAWSLFIESGQLEAEPGEDKKNS
ncbi:putative PurR-regulated permease PerM [Variovorax paradoxus]|jgi:predicted PurR-regulated permease PerM|uniref:AI-2E family transporter n=1 Tax=Variovorax paradoxus TaxID=34073 RepID=UPI00277D80FF|nr:AI-2E family transporter [Variovorax paradoxus]MDP9932498.1 putative PurR-regulated permease PerM [Variovorax paradoxus]MDQ0027780.1 putative PurR-regulated permease PerM [Variovorax paradoxus]